MNTAEYDKENAYYRELAQFEEVEKIRLSLHGFTPNQFQEKYLEQWKYFLSEHPHYLYPDDLLIPYDTLAYEYKPRTESATTESYQNIERLLVEARDEYADGLTRHYNQICQNGSLRQVLAERLANLAMQLKEYAFLQELSGSWHVVQLPTWDIEASTKPKEVGFALALLIHFLEIHKQFLAEEANTGFLYDAFEHNSKASKMIVLTTSDEEAERRGKAYLYTQDMVAKYSAIHGMEKAFNDYHWWQEEIAVTGASGNQIYYWHCDYPLPYCHKYFRRFVELFLSRNSDEILLAALAHEFPAGDETDANYVEALIRRAKDCHLFEEGGVLGFDGDEMFTYFILKPGEYLPQTGLISRISSSNIFYGTKTNEDHAKAIRKWFKRRAKMPLPPKTTLDSSLQQGDTSSKIIDFVFTNLTLNECCAICEKVGIDSDKTTYRAARAWGIAEVLVYYSFVAKGQTSELMQALAKAYKIKAKLNYVPDKLTQARKGARIRTNEKLKELGKITKTDFEKLSNISSKSQITRNFAGK